MKLNIEKMIIPKLIVIISFYLKYVVLLPLYPESQNNLISKITFGSCFKTYNLGKDNKIFKAVQERNPDLWIWLGDTAYLDNLNNKLSFFEEDYVSDHVKTVFNYSKNNIEYNKLAKTTNIIGIWDDHDFGEDDGGFDFKYKEIIKQNFLDFLDEPNDSIRREKGKGLQVSYSFGEGYKSVKIILLDDRYYSPKMTLLNKIKDMSKSVFEYYSGSGQLDYNNIEENISILGEEQWIYLENELKSSKETIIIIGFGIQILAFNKGLNEAITYYDRKRLFRLISKYKKSGIIFITGDIHHGQIQKTFCIIEDIGYHIYEITSSGLTHNCVFNSYEICQKGWDYLLPHEYNIELTTQDFNFGMINIDWGNDDNFDANKNLSELENENILKNINIKIELINNNGVTIRSNNINYFNDLIYKKISDDTTCLTNIYFYGFKGLIYVFFITLLNRFFNRVLSLIILLILINLSFLILIIVSIILCKIRCKNDSFKKSKYNEIGLDSFNKIKTN